jgi:hypothetical protein
MAGSSIYILIFGNLFSLCFVWVAAISVENALDKFFVSGLLRSKHSYSKGHRDWALLTEEAAEKVPDKSLMCAGRGACEWRGSCARVWTPARQPVWRPALHRTGRSGDWCYTGQAGLETGATQDRLVWRVALHFTAGLEGGATLYGWSGGWRYSARSALTGSICAARHAGRRQAAVAEMSRVAVTERNTFASSGLVP